MPETLTVRSPDGALLAVHRSGSGTPLVLVHGIAGDATRWIVAEALAEHFTLYVLDRRGRGKSSDGSSYALAREAEDVAAVVAHAEAEEGSGGDVHLLGHSFGGLLALEAANLVAVKKLLVYEPYAPLVPSPEASPITRSFEAMIATPEALVERFLSQIVQVKDNDLARLRETASWPMRVAAGPTIPREMAAVECHRLTVDGLLTSKTQVRFLLGETSPAFIRDATTRIHAMIRGSDVVDLPGQGHVAMDTAPLLFEREVRNFFKGDVEKGAPAST